MILLALIIALLVPHAAPAPPRYVILTLDVRAYGVGGTGRIVVDRERGRFVRTFDTFPTSEGEGYDGTRAWRADASGMARVQGNLGRRQAIRAWAALFVRLARGERITHAQLHDGIDRVDVDVADYREFGERIFPCEIHTVLSTAGEWTARVRRIEERATLDDATFAPPAEPHDFTLTHATSVAMDMTVFFPVVPVAIDGTLLHMIVDTGGSNVLVPAAAKRLGLAIVGEALVAGAGEHAVPSRFTAVERMRIGDFELRHCAFIVLGLNGLIPPASTV